MKIAILHEMFVKLGGAEKVVENWMGIFPDADLFTLIYDEEKVGKIFPKCKINKQVFDLQTQKIYKLTKKQRLCFPFMAKSIEQLDFSLYDVVLCSSSGFAHGAITKPETKFIVYYHSPARYMWDWTNEYKRDISKNKIVKTTLKFVLNKMFLGLRQWDYIASNRHDITIANSENTARRIEKYYKKDSIVLFPPVETDRFAQKIIFTTKEKVYKDYYIILSALTEFKKIEVAIEAFNNMPEKNLLVIGEGDYRKNLEKLSENKAFFVNERKRTIDHDNLFRENNIVFSGAKYGDELVSLVQNSNGLIFPGEEDFGIVPIEVMAAGKSVFAYRGGGLLETVIEGKTGEFFNEKDGADFIDKFLVFDENNKNDKYKASVCAKQAANFSKEKFEEKIKSLVKN